MIPFETDVISVIDNAYRAGFFMPKYYFEKDAKVLEGSSDEIYYVDPLYIVKPKGIEFTYIMFWNGFKLCAGYISINNNYTGLQRGGRGFNGGTLFAAKIQYMNVSYKKLSGGEPMWLAHSFVLTDKGKMFYFGTDDIDKYIEPIEKLTGKDFVELTDLYLAKEKTRKPEGFVSFIPVLNHKNLEEFIYTGDVQTSVTKSWNTMYEKLECLRINMHFLPGVDSYIRKAYAQMQTARVLI